MSENLGNPLVAATAASSVVKNITPSVQKLFGAAIVGGIVYVLYNTKKGINYVKASFASAGDFIAEVLQFKETEREAEINRYAVHIAFTYSLWRKYLALQKETKTKTYYFFTYAVNGSNFSSNASARAKQISGDVYAALDGWNNYASALGALKKCMSWTDISYLSEYFFTRYKVDLFSYLRKQLDERQMLEVLGYFFTLPEIKQT